MLLGSIVDYNVRLFQLGVNTLDFNPKLDGCNPEGVIERITSILE